LDLAQLSRQVLYNCDVSDARHAGIYSVCGLAMRLRDLYKWEHGLAPWQEDEAARVLEWIGAKEELWETLLEAGYGDLPVDGRRFEPFDTHRINAALAPFNLFYGAGYAHSLKPTFFLAEISRDQTVASRRVRVLGRELARDLLTLPAFGQDGEVVVREHAARMFLWDQIAYISNSGRRALDFALAACGLPDARTETIRCHFDDVARVQQQIILDHEIGELEETVFPRDTWQAMLADYPHTTVELLVRTLKDLLADTSLHGALTGLIDHRNEAALGLYLAFGNGITRLLTRELICAFDAFIQDRRWDRMMAAAREVRQRTVAHTRRVLGLYHEGRKGNDLERTQRTIEAFMRRQGWLPG
jgi:hypothetical protein